MRKIYLSGPMRGYPDLNYPEFHRVAALLRAEGHIVYNPAEFEHHGDFPIREAFAEYLAFICNRADTIVMLPGWEKSQGAMAEYMAAVNCGIDIQIYGKPAGDLPPVATVMGTHILH